MKNPAIVIALVAILVVLIAGIVVVVNVSTQAHDDHLRAICVQEGYSDCNFLNHKQLQDFEGK